MQIAYQVYRRVLPPPRLQPVAGARAKEGLRHAVFLPAPVPSDTGRRIAFLNHPVSVDPESLDWHGGEFPKLWRYNLHYFDYLSWPGLTTGQKTTLADSWIRANPPGGGDGWEPYPLSLRTVNWIKHWLSGEMEAPIPQAWTNSLASQLAWLAMNLEQHILANHLLKNAKALVFGGMYLAGPDAIRWLHTGLRIMVAEADEQVLADGGHFERSPMYHGIVLEDYLDVVNLAQSNPGLIADDALARLAATARRAASFLADITAGDGRIPLFNDSAFGITRDPADLLDYARRVLGDLAVEEGAGPRRICLPDTGYFGYRRGGDSLMLDCGPVGPDYQPGHAHCDTLSYELCVDGERVVVDSGVYSYEVDDTRQLVRSTAAHNTVRVDGAEQSEIWAAFRVGRRARPIRAELGDWAGGQLEFQGAHDGYRFLPGRPIHQRRVVMDPSGRWEVFDLITGRGKASHRTETFIHLNSAFQVEQTGPGCFALRSRATGLELVLTVTCGSPARVEQGYYFPEFGLREQNNKIVIERQGPLPLEMSYRIERRQRANTVPHPLLPA